MASSAQLATAPSVMLPSAMAWIRAAADRIQHLYALERSAALIRAIDVLEEVEANVGAFGADGFDWSPDAAVIAVDEFLGDCD